MRKALIVLGIILLSLASVSPAFAAEGSRVRLGEDVVVGPGERIDGDVTSFGGNIQVLGEVSRDVVAIGGNVTISGKVGRDATAVGGNVDLQETAVVQRDVLAVGGKVSRAPGAVVGRNTVEGGPGRFGGLPRIPGLVAFQGQGNPLLSLVSSLVAAFAMMMIWLVIGVLAVALFPRQVAAVSETLEFTPAKTIIVGILTAMLLPFGIVVGSVVLAITIVGILVIPLFFLGVAVAQMYGLVAIGYLIGGKILRGFGVQQVSPFAAEVVGLLVLGALTLLPAALLSCLGFPLLYVVAAIGLAAVILSRFGTLRPTRAAAQAQPF